MEENFNKLIIGKIDDFLDILQEITIRVDEDRIKHPEKYKDLTRFEIYENCRDLSLKYYNSIKGKDILDFDDSIEEFLDNEYNVNKYTSTIAIIRVGYAYFLYQMNLVATVEEEVINKYKLEHKVKDDIECVKFLPTNKDQQSEDLIELKKELVRLQSLRYIALYRIKSTDKYDFKILIVNTKNIDPSNLEQVKDQILMDRQLNLNEIDNSIIVEHYSDKCENLFIYMVNQLNHMK